MKGKTTPRQMWVPIAIHRYQGDSAEKIHEITGIAKTTVHNLLKDEDYKLVEQRIFEALDMEQLNVHSLVEHAVKDIQSAPTTPETGEEPNESGQSDNISSVPVNLGDVDTQM